MTVTVVVIMFELTGALTYILPTMVSLSLISSTAVRRHALQASDRIDILSLDDDRDALTRSAALNRELAIDARKTPRRFCGA